MSLRLPTEADLPRLPYTEAVFNETMRLYPPAHATNRHTDKAPMQVCALANRLTLSLPPQGCFVPCFRVVAAAAHTK